MKYLYVAAAAALLLLSVPAEAQVTFSVGPRFGFNFGSMSFTPLPADQVQAGALASTQGGRFGIMFGAAGYIQFGKYFGAEMELLYMMKGAHFDQNAGGFNAQAAAANSTTIHINELVIPLLFKVGYQTGSIRPYGFVGPEFGFILSATESSPNANGVATDIDLTSSAGGVDQFGNQVGNGNQVGGIDFSLVFGGGAEYFVAKNIGLTLDIRYDLGLSNIFSTPVQNQQQVQQVQSPSWKTSGFQIMLGTMFRIG